jgi:tetratricopeptide (TPR) repeat protein
MADQAGVLCGGFQENTIRVLRVFLDLGGFYVRLGDVSKGEALFGRILSTSRLMPFDAFMASAQEAMADLDMTRRRFAEAEAYYRQAIGIMDHNGYRKEEADLLDKLADVCDKELKVQDAAAARGRAKALRGAP